MDARYFRKFGTTLLVIGVFFFNQQTGSAPPEVASKPSVATTPTTNCTIVQWDKGLFAHPYLTIRQPGKYCIDKNYRLSCVNGAGKCGGGPLIEIVADNVDLDLQGHTLSREGRPLEILGRGFNISVRNGSIRNGSIRIRTPDTPNEPINGDKPMKEPDLKEDSFIRVEDIHLESGAIFVSGANALIRNNEVASEAEDLAPVSVYGPHAVIEKNLLNRISSVSQFHSYGIYLRNGVGSVIRENVLQNKGTHENTFAFGLRNSQGVTIMNNQIHNFSTTVEHLGQSDEQQKGNFVQ